MLTSLLDEAVALLAISDVEEERLARAAAWLMAEDRALVAVLGQRADEHLFSTRLRLRAQMAADLSHGFAAVDPIEALAGRGDDPLAQAAQAVLGAESDRLDGFGEPTFRFREMPLAMRSRLLWVVSAVTQEDPGADDAARIAIGAVANLPADEPERVDHAASILVGALDPVREDRWLAGEVLSWGHLAVTATLIGRSSGIAVADVRHILVRGQSEDLIAVVRSVSAGDPIASANLLLTVAQGRSGETDGAGATAQAWLELSTAIDPEVEARRLRALALPADYRAALAGLAPSCS